MSLMIGSARKRPAKDKDEINIPEDIWTEIFLRIPMQRVYEFRGISKYFKGLIDSDEFIRSHYDVSIKTRPSLIIHPRTYSNEGGESTVIHVDLGSDYKVNELKPPFSGSRFLGCQKGILCYQLRGLDKRDSLMFWNPLTGVCRRSTRHALEDEGFQCRYFVGHDALTDDLKVVKVMRKCWTEGYVCYVTYSSKMDSWRTTQGMNIERNGKRVYLDHLYPVGEAFVEGTNCIHVVAREGDSPYAGKILAFDFGSETFKLVPLPQIGTNWDALPGGIDSAGLSSVDGCLCVYTPCVRDYFLKAWIMKKYGDGESWAPLLSIPDDIQYLHRLWCDLEPFGFLVNKGRLQLMLSSVDHHEGAQTDLYLYDVHQKQLINTERRCLDKSEIMVPRYDVFAPSRRKP